MSYSKSSMSFSDSYSEGTALVDLIEWMQNLPEHHFVELFETGEELVVHTRTSGVKRKRTVLKRSEDMEKAMITVVKKGLEDEQWQGLFYVMGKGRFPEFTPLYIGITRRAGGKQKISSNIAKIETNKSKFARWGDSSAYHIGDLSRVVFMGRPSVKYEKWGQALFATYDPPKLKEQIYLYVVPWYQDSIAPSGRTCTLDDVEKEMIALASAQFGDCLLNTSGTRSRGERAGLNLT